VATSLIRREAGGGLPRQFSRKQAHPRDSPAERLDPRWGLTTSPVEKRHVVRLVTHQTRGACTPNDNCRPQLVNAVDSRYGSSSSVTRAPGMARLIYE
jgi:hypothetical protein